MASFRDLLASTKAQIREVETAEADAMRAGEGVVVLDVREPDEYAAGHVAGAVNVPLSQLRTRHGELPRDRKLAVYCAAGQRAYYATRFLLQNGYDAANLSGGYTTYRALHAVGLAPV